MTDSVTVSREYVAWLLEQRRRERDALLATAKPAEVAAR